MAKCPDCGTGFTGSFSSGNIYCPSCRLARNSTKSAEAISQQNSILNKQILNEQRNKKEALDLEKRRLREEQRHARAMESAARDASRSVLHLEVECPACSHSKSVSLVSDGETTVRCSSCNNLFTVDYTGDITLLGPHNSPLRSNEDISIKIDRHCAECTFNHSSSSRQLVAVLILTILITTIYAIGFSLINGNIWKYSIAIFIPAGLMAYFLFLKEFMSLDEDVCRNKKINRDEQFSRHLNSNFRCKLWNKNSSLPWLDWLCILMLLMAFISLIMTFKHAEPVGSVKIIYNALSKSEASPSIISVDRDEQTNQFINDVTSDLDLQLVNSSSANEKVQQDTSHQLQEKMVKTSSVSNANGADDLAAKKQTDNESRLELLQVSLAAVIAKIESERKRWREAKGVVDALSQHGAKTVLQGSPDYARFIDSQKIIREIEAGAQELKDEKAEIEVKIEAIRGDL